MHYDGDPEFTKVIKCQTPVDDRNICMTVGQALSSFLSDFKGKNDEGRSLLHFHAWRSFTNLLTACLP